MRRALSESRGFYLVGPAGVGKSRLLAEFEEICQGEGTEVIFITGAEAAREIPLGPLLGIVDLSREGNLAQLVITELADRARKRAIVLIVDDAHLMDPTSAAVLHNIARSNHASTPFARSARAKANTKRSLSSLA